MRKALSRVALLLVCSAAVVFAQKPAPLNASERTTLERVSLGNARSNLAAAVAKLPLKPDLNVAAWAARNAGLDRELRAWLRSQPRGGEPRVFSDRTADSDVRLAPDELARQLIALREKHDAAASSPAGLSAADITAAARNWPTLWVEGNADLSNRDDSAKPEGWDDITAEGVQIARLAAAADAAAALVEEAAKLKVTAARRLFEFLDAGTEIRLAVVDAVRQAGELKIECAPDQVATAELTIRIGDFIHVLTDVHQKHYRGDLFQAADFREMALNVGKNELRASGLAIPPERHRIRPEFELIDADVPPWVSKSVTAIGRYVPVDGDDFPPAVRQELARWDALDQLRKQVEVIRIQGDLTVEQFLGYRTFLKDDVVVFLTGARVTNRADSAADGVLTVTAELPLRRLWLILRRGATIIEQDPPAASMPAAKSSEVEPAP